MNEHVAGLLLAAGGSRRLGEPKQLLRGRDGETLVHRAARLLLEAHCQPVVVVTGADAPDVRVAVEDLNLATVHNATWASGMGSSIAAGTAHIATHHDAASSCPRGILILPCDMPTVDLAHLRSLLVLSGSGIMRAASTYQDDTNETVVGIPAIFPRSDWPLLMALQGDRGARALLRGGPTATLSLEGGPSDIDTLEDARRWHLLGCTNT